MTAEQRILVKRAEMLALTKSYEKAMAAGERAIMKIASAEMARRDRMAKAYGAIKGLLKASSACNGPQKGCSAIAGRGGTYYKGDPRKAKGVLADLKARMARGEQVNPNFMRLMQDISSGRR